MGHDNQFLSIVETLRQKTGLPLELLDDDSRICFTAENALIVNLWHQPGSDELILYTILSELTKLDLDKPLLLRLMQANCFWQETGRGTIGVHPSLNSAILSRSLPFGRETSDNIEDILSDFIHSGMHCKQLVVDTLNAAEHDEKSDDFDAPHSTMPSHSSAPGHPMQQHILKG